MQMASLHDITELVVHMSFTGYLAYYQHNKWNEYNKAVNSGIYNNYQIVDGIVSTNDKLCSPFYIDDDKMLHLQGKSDILMYADTVKYGAQHEYTSIIPSGSTPLPLLHINTDIDWTTHLNIQLHFPRQITIQTRHTNQHIEVDVDDDVLDMNPDPKPLIYDPMDTISMVSQLNLATYPKNITDVGVGFWYIPNYTQQSCLLKYGLGKPKLVAIGDSAMVATKFKRLIKYRPIVGGIAISIGMLTSLYHVDLLNLIKR